MFCTKLWQFEFEKAITLFINDVTFKKGRLWVWSWFGSVNSEFGKLKIYVDYMNLKVRFIKNDLDLE